MKKCPTCRHCFLTRNGRDSHAWQCPLRLAACADWLFVHAEKNVA